MNDKAPPASDPALFAMIFQQNWENARHIKSERIWFMNTCALISAGILSLLESIRGEPLLQLSMMFFMCVFSLIGLLTSFRLKAELEECLAKLEAMVTHEQAGGVRGAGTVGRHIDSSSRAENPSTFGRFRRTTRNTEGKKAN